MKSLGTPTEEERSGVEKLKVSGSIAIHRIDYTDDDILIVYMNDGSKLEYSGVSRTTFNDFQKAESKGGFFNRQIRNKYTYLG
jgi:hypothetical protein